MTYHTPSLMNLKEAIDLTCRRAGLLGVVEPNPFMLNLIQSKNGHPPLLCTQLMTEPFAVAMRDALAPAHQSGLKIPAKIGTKGDSFFVYVSAKDLHEPIHPLKAHIMAAPAFHGLFELTKRVRSHSAHL